MRAIGSLALTVLITVPTGASTAFAQCARGGIPVPAGPVTAGPTVPTTPHAVITGHRQLDLITSWRFWWELNKEPYLNLPAAEPGPLTGQGAARVGVRRAHDAAQLGRVVEALNGAVDVRDQRDLLAATLVAKAKMDLDFATVHPSLRRHVGHADRQVREAAVLALGISAQPAAVGDLIGLLHDAPAGRKLVDKLTVDDPLRYFAAYGLGLIAHASADTQVRTRIFDALASTLKDKATPRDVKLATVHALRLIRPRPDLGSRDKRQQWLGHAALWGYHETSLGKAERAVQAQVPQVIGELLGRGSGTERARFKALFADLLRGRHDRAEQQSAALALGALALPREVEPDDAACSDVLRAHFKNGKDESARHFSLIALAQIGGDHNRGELLGILARCKKIDKPWAGLALGILAHEIRATSGKPDATIGRALQNALRKARDPESRSALSVAVGLSGHAEAATELTALLRKSSQQDLVAGYACLGLGLLQHRPSTGALAAILADSAARPELFRQSAIALALLGVRDVTTQVHGALADAKLNNAQKQRMAAEVLGQLRDRRAIPVLLTMLADRDLDQASRAAVATALGSICEKEALPWSSKIAVNMNYPAAMGLLSQPTPGLQFIL